MISCLTVGHEDCVPEDCEIARLIARVATLEAAASAPILDTFLGGDPRRFQALPEGLRGSLQYGDPFFQWVSRCEAADRDEADARTLDPYSLNEVRRAEDGSLWKSTGECLYCHFGIGLNHAAPGDWRAWAEPLRLPMAVRRRESAERDLANARERLATFVPDDDPDPEERDHTTFEDVQRNLAWAETRLAERVSEEADVSRKAGP